MAQERSYDTADESGAATTGAYRHWSERQAASERADRYSRLVGRLKIILPLFAAGIFLFIIAYPGLFDDDGFDLSFESVGTLNDDLRMVSPRFTGTTENNRAYVVTADAAIQNPKNPNKLTLQSLQAVMKHDDGGVMTVTANNGLLNLKQNFVFLSGDVVITSDLGYVFYATKMSANFTKGIAWSDDPVRGEGPPGTVEADRFRATDNGAHIYFDGNVKMTFVPERIKEQ